MEQGIMGINQSPVNMGQEPSPEEIQAFEQLRSQASPKEVADSALQGAQEQDPELIGALKELLSSVALPAPLINALMQLLDGVLADPSLYPNLVQALLDLGVDQEDIPPEFDAEFVSTLKLVMTQIQPTDEPMMEDQEPQRFAEGGAVSMKPIARYLASMGRGGDTMLAHINPEEARLLASLGGSGTINPHTGLPEFFFKKIFKGIKNAVKGVVKGAKSILKSDVGRIVGTIAIGAYLGPAAAQALGAKSFAAQAATAAFVGTAGSGFLAGDGLKNSLTTGAKVAGITYATAPALQAAFGTPLDPSLGPDATFGEKFASGFKAPESEFGSLFTKTPIQDRGIFGDAPLSTEKGGVFAPKVAEVPISSNVVSNAEGELIYSPKGFEKEIQARELAMRDPFNKFADISKREQFIVPDQITDDIYSTDAPYFKKLGQYSKDVTGGITDVLTSPFKKDVTFGQGLERIGTAVKGMPGTTAALGITAAGMAGAFDPPPPSPSDLAGLDLRRGYDLYRANPEMYGLPVFRPNIVYPEGYGPIPRAADGGIAQNFPRMTGEISGPGTGTSDDIPAMLSDGEFVFTAKAVRNAGDGDREKGANRMYSMMKNLERAA